MPNNVWCDNEDCIYHEDGMCDIGDLAIDCNGCCMGSLREYEEYKRSRPVAETVRVESPFAEENERLRALVSDLYWDVADAVSEQALPYEKLREYDERMREIGFEAESRCKDD